MVVMNPIADNAMSIVAETRTGSSARRHPSRSRTSRATTDYWDIYDWTFR